MYIRRIKTNETFLLVKIEHVYNIRTLNRINCVLNDDFSLMYYSYTLFYFYINKEKRLFFYHIWFVIAGLKCVECWGICNL